MISSNNSYLNTLNIDLLNFLFTSPGNVLSTILFLNIVVDLFLGTLVAIVKLALTDPFLNYIIYVYVRHNDNNHTLNPVT